MLKKTTPSKSLNEKDNTLTKELNKLFKIVWYIVLRLSASMYSREHIEILQDVLGSYYKLVSDEETLEITYLKVIVLSYFGTPLQCVQKASPNIGPRTFKFHDDHNNLTPLSLHTVVLRFPTLSNL